MSDARITEFTPGNEVAAAHLERALTAAQQRISDLEAQCARVQRDAARYAWLRELREDDSISVVHWSAVDGNDDEAADERTGAPLHYDQMDAAIDAAMAPKGAG